MQTLVFRSKVDAWLKIVVVVTIVICVAAIIGVSFAGGFLGLAILPLLIIPIGLLVWLLRSTDYTLSDSHLDVRSGPFAWRVPLKDVRSISPTRNPLSSPALSLDRLRIDYGRGGSVMISPADKDTFVRELEARRVRASRGVRHSHREERLR